MQLGVPILLVFLFSTVPTAGAEEYTFQGQDTTSVETEAHITAQDRVVYVGESVNFTCTTKSREIPEYVAWLMYEEDVTSASFVTLTTSEGSPEKGLVKFSSTITITRALFNQTSIIRCRIKISGQGLLHLSTPLTISQNTTGRNKQIGDQCAVSDKCLVEHSTCRSNKAESTPGTCQCDADHPVLSTHNEVSCLQAANVNQPCVDSTQCQHSDEGTQCEDRVCRCKTSFSLEHGKCVAKVDGNLCQTSSACVDPDAECVDGRCLCRAGFASNPSTKLCELNSDQEFQMAVVGASSVGVLLVFSGIVAACFVVKRRKEGASTGRY